MSNFDDLDFNQIDWDNISAQPKKESNIDWDAEVKAAVYGAQKKGSEPPKKGGKPLSVLGVDVFPPAVRAGAGHAKDAFNEYVGSRNMGLGTRNVATGLLYPFTAIGDAANAAVNLGIDGLNAMGADIPKLNSVSYQAQAAMDSAGLPRAETDREKLYGAIQEGGASALSPGMAMKMLKQAVPSVFTQRMPTQIIAGGSGAGASEATRQGGGSAGEQIGAGLLASILTPSLANAAGELIKGGIKGAGTLISPWTKGGQEKIAGRMLRQAASNPERAIGNLEDAKMYVPGSEPTTIEASKDLGLQAFGRSIRNKNNTNVAKFKGHENAQNRARVEYFEKLAGNNDKINRAINIREQKTEPLRKIAINKQSSPVDVKPVVEKIDGILSGGSGERDAIANTLNNVRSKFFDGKSLKTDIERLYGIRKHIGDLLDSKFNSDVNQQARAARSQLLEVRDTLDSQISNVSKEYGQYLKLYRNMSKPIDRMKTLQGMKIVNAAPDSEGVRQISQPKWFNQFEGNKLEWKKVLTPKQMNRMERITKDLDRGATAMSVSAKGSDTALNLSTAEALGHILSGRPGQTGVIRGVTGALDMLYKAPAQQVEEVILRVMTDPKGAATLMRKATPSAMKTLNQVVKEKAIALGLGSLLGLGSSVQQ